MDAFTAINPNLVGFDPSNVANALLGGGTAFTFDPSSFAMVSGDTSAAFYDGSLALGIGAGLIITSGTLPGATNTAGYFGVSNNMPGDPMLDAVVNSVFPTISLDATTISFSFTVDDPSITGVSFNVVFGSDEYPEWVNQFVDVAAIWVNGTNVAYFNNDPAAPLSVIGSNLSSNYFINNTGNLTTPSFGGVARPGVTSLLPIEYDGVSAPLTVYAPVHQGVNTLKIGIADTRDHIYDSGMFISNMLGTSIPVTGITRDIDGSGDNDLLQGSADAEDIHGNLGDDEIRAAGGNDVILADDGNDYITAGAGDDYVDGGAGNDVAAYSGASIDYSITANADGTTTVTDLRDFSPDGSDTLKGVEAVQFSDIAIDLATMLETAKTAAPQTTVPVGAPPALIPADGALPAVTAPITVFTLEDGETEGVNAFENIEADPASLTVAFAPGAQLPGVSYNATTHKFLLDTSDASFQSLAAGEQTTLAVDYTVSNSASSTDASIVYTVTGTNDAPVVAAAAVQVTQGAAPVTVDGLANASDVDNGAALSVVADLGFGADDTGVDPGAPETEVHGNGGDAPAGQVPAFAGGDYTLAALPTFLTYDALTGQFTLDPADPAFA
ncbi:MAG: choice-of-anchor L domain-containing protein, partial [Alphaproteobacteria bacterium]|nr:choice-of-anchor L domain-containing protein [Alphaproteobacteria bacterium]